jgi:DNA-binding CsgD family transcriptional regulator
MSLLSELTDRERDVMLLAIQGYPNKEIARHLGISHRTVEIHKSKIMHKTGATNLLDLARIAHEGITDK